MSGSVVLLAKRKFNPRTLFSSNEQGLWLDPSDMTAGKAGWRRNLLLNTEPADSTGYSFATNISFVTESAFSFLPSAGRAAGYGDSSVNRRLQFSFTSFVTGQSYTLSFYIYLDGGVEPNQGAGSYREFTITRDGQDVTNYANITYDNIGGGVYRVKHTWTHTGTGNAITVWKYAGLNTNTNFRASGFQLELGSTPTEYQRITDFSTEFKAAYPTHTLYQDSNGVTPCTAAGDPVGLILDQSRGGLSQIGADLVTNGTFAADSDWTKGANWTIGSGVATKTGGAANNLTQTIGSTAAAWYRISLDVTRSAGTLTVSLGTSGTTYAITATGSYTFFILAGSGTQTLTLAGDSSFAGTVDNVVVRNVPGNNAYQTSSSARPTLARIPSSGRRNVLVRSEEFDNASWARTAVGVTANTATSPWAASATADLIVEDSATSAHSISQTVSLISGVTYTLSLWAKTSGRNLQIVLASGFVNQGYVNFDLTSGEVGNQSVGTTATINAYSGGWYFCTVTFTSASTTSAGINIGLITSKTAVRAESYLGNSTSGVIVDRAQLETGSTATNYQKVVATTDVTESGVGDLWHLVFDGSDDSLVTNSIPFDTWTQETRRNLLTNVEDFDNAAWTQAGVTVSANAGTDPLGTVLADRLVETAANSEHRIQNSTTLSVTSGTVYTASIYAKAGEVTIVRVGFDDQVKLPGRAFFNLSLGTVSFTEAGSATITAVGNGWYRCTITGTCGTSHSSRLEINLVQSGTTAIYAGNTSNGLLLWGAQLETGSTATTYQRVATDEMTVIAGVRQAVTPSAENVIVELSAAYVSNSGTFILNTNSSPNIGFAARGTSTGFYTPSATFPSTNVLSCNFDISGAALAQQIIPRINGQLSQSNPFGSLGSGNFGNYQLFIGRRNQATLPYNGHIYQLIIRGKTTPTGKLLEAERFVARKTGVSF